MAETYQFRPSVESGLLGSDRVHVHGAMDMIDCLTWSKRRYPKRVRVIHLEIEIVDGLHPSANLHTCWLF